MCNYVTINTVSSSRIKECSDELYKIFSELTNDYNNIDASLSSYSSLLNTIKSYNNTYTNNPVKISNGFLFTKAKYQVSVRKIDVIGDEGFSESVNEFKKSTIDENIKILADKSNDLRELSESVAFYIMMIERQLLGDNPSDEMKYNGNLIDFLKRIKNDDGWEEIKENNKKSLELKQTDEIFLKFHSNNPDEYDYVDFALDHLGTSFLTTTYSSLPAVWYSHFDNKGLKSNGAAKPSDEWCAEFVSYCMYNTDNADKIPGAYISCADAAKSFETTAFYEKGLREKLEEKDYSPAEIESELERLRNDEELIGEWHDADSDYQPKRGDIFIRNGHTGIVVASDDEYIYTIEGNTARNDGSYYAIEDPDFSRGGVVNTRIRPKSYVDLGYLTPDSVDTIISKERMADSNNPVVSKDYFKMKREIDETFAAIKKSRDDSGHVYN